MNDSTNRIALLLDKYRDQTATAREEDELYELIAAEGNEAAIKEWLMTVMEEEEGKADIERSKWETVLQRILERGKEQQRAVVIDRTRGFYWKRIAVAASIVGVLFVGYWMMRPSTTLSPATDPSTALRTDVPAPDKNRAMIKMADGTIVYLDSAGNGELAIQGDVKIVKTADGKIIYEGPTPSPSQGGDVIAYNTLSNPRGSIVMNMTLADGSRVWLNAGSSVTYPVAFVGNERKVTITGEAYFEVAHNAAKPFYVSKGDVSVQVLGTHFNVNAYDDEESIKVTLLEGSVRVQPIADSRKSILIKPGQQAKVVNGETSVVSNVDVEQVMAWKNGRFEFKSTDIETIMREVARWYDVEIVYNEQVNQRFNGKIPRTMSAMNVFKVLEETGGVHFKIEGRKVFVNR